MSLSDLSTTIPNMSTEDLVTILVARTFSEINEHDLARVLGYQPHSTQLRYTREQCNIAILKQRFGGPSLADNPDAAAQPTGLWKQWTTDWVLCKGPKRVEQKRNVEARMKVVEERLRESERREVEAGFLRNGDMERERSFRREYARFQKAVRVRAAMAMEGIPMGHERYKRDSFWYEKVVLNEGGRVVLGEGGSGMVTLVSAGSEESSTRRWLRDVLGKKKERRVLEGLTVKDRTLVTSEEVMDLLVDPDADLGELDLCEVDKYAKLHYALEGRWG